MVLKYHLSPYPSSPNNWTVKIWEAASDGPGAEVYTQTIPQPHNTSVTVTVNGLDRVAHIVRLYDAVTSALLHEYNVEPLTDTVTVFNPIRFKIGDGGALTPAAGTATYTNSILNGMGANDYVVHRNNYGDLHPTVHYTPDGANNRFTLIAPDVFNNGEEFTIKPNPKVLSTIVNDSVVGKWFGGFQDINANMNYAASHLRKLLRFTGAFTYTYPAATTIPIGYGFCFNNMANTGQNGTIAFSNAPLKWIDGTTKTSLTVPPNTEGCFVFDGTNWNVVYFNESKFANNPAQTVGSIVGTGLFSIVDVPAGDNIYNVTHNLNISGDYMVLYSIRGSSATHTWDNDVIAIWYHHATDKPNKFVLSVSEERPGGQNITIAWTIIKL